MTGYGGNMKTKTTTIILSFLLAAGMLFIAVSPAISAEDVPKMTVEALKGALDNPDLIILDVRRGGDWRSSEFKIQGAHRVDPGDFGKWAEKFPKDKTLVLYCA
jgi:hypothetical protein